VRTNPVSVSLRSDEVSTPPGACLSPRPPSDPEQTYVAGGSWMLAPDIGALPVLPGAALWSPD